ncbi:serine hydrolase domain-containing protein [Devosia sp.]|uniref:serine hydrolase domain-containing protein n=1 Tax=Devosia sp. TaxID=1871048 RepID=UPI0032641368
MTLESGLDRTIDAALADSKIVGCVIRVGQHGKTVYQRAAGYADREAKTPVKPDTIFRLASVTKPLVAVTTLAMVDEGKLGLDDAVSDHLPYFTPKFAGRTATIRIRHLLSHTSGLSYSYPDSEISGGLADTDLDFETNFPRLAARDLNYEPGTAWEYSMAIDVLGAVVSKVFGGTLEQAVQHYVAGPLGMADTAFHVTDISRLAVPYANAPTGAIRMADNHPYTEDNGGIISFSPARIFNKKAFQSGGAGAASTPNDIFKFLDTLRAGGASLLKPETFQAAASNQIGEVPRDDAGQRFGFLSAVLVDPIAANSPQSIGTLNWGGIYGHSWFIDLAKGLTVTMMSNTAPEGCNGKFTSDIRDDVYRGL